MEGIPPAGTFMVPLGECPSLNENETVYIALTTLKNSLHGDNGNGAWQGNRLVVVYRGGVVPIGILTLKNILQAVHIKMLAGDPFFKSECFSWYYINKLQEKGGTKVREIMRSLEEVTVNYNCSVYKAARLFAKHGVNHIPVRDGSQFVGILNARDLFYHYYELTRFNMFRENSTDTDPAEYVGYATV